MVIQTAGSSWPRFVLSLFVVLIRLHWINGQEQDSFPPVLLKSPCCAEVAENSSVGTPVYQINVTNRDSNDALTYTLLGGHEYFEFRNSSNRGIITIKRQVDREMLLSDIVQLKVEVSDGVHEPVTGDVCVLITDVNDNAPIPVNVLYSVSLPEDSNVGRTVVNVRAKDADEGTNSHVQYRFMKGNKDGRFSISPFSGDIKLETSLDYESQPRSYMLTVQTYDLGKPSLSATAKVDINVININDNKPHFQKDVFVGNQEEGTPAHTSIVKVIATDLDSGIFGKLSYSIVGGNDDGRFYINNTTGDISNAKVLDREQQNSYNLAVEVTDGGLTKLTDQTTVHIVVRDVNDNRPQFHDKQKSVTVAENNVVGVIVAAFSAVDRDIGTNSRLTYTIVAGDTGNAFDIADSSKGIVTATKRLDHETMQMYTLTIEVRDGGPKGAMTDSATLIVYVKNLNDNSPRFASPSYSFQVYENEIDIVVGRVSATDADGHMFSHGQVSYDLIGRNHNRFYIDPASGVITTTVAIDREGADSEVYHLLVVAKDNSTTESRQTTANLTITILDENDNAPLFEENDYEVTVREEQPPGQTITRVSATDKDSSSNGVVRYAIVDGLGKDKFAIDPSTGYISTRTSLDREIQDSFTLTLKAEDGGSPPRTSKASLTVTVEDINDNQPYFESSAPDTLSLPENTLVGTTVLTVTARDDDIGLNGKVAYTLEGGEGKFVVNRNTGELTTRMLRSGHYTLRVIASDSGHEPRSTTETLVVTVIGNKGTPDQGIIVPSTVVVHDKKNAASPAAIGVVTVLASLFLHVVVTSVLDL